MLLLSFPPRSINSDSMPLVVVGPTDVLFGGAIFGNILSEEGGECVSVVTGGAMYFLWIRGSSRKWKSL